MLQDDVHIATAWPLFYVLTMMKDDGNVPDVCTRCRCCVLILMGDDVPDTVVGPRCCVLTMMEDDAYVANVDPRCCVFTMMEGDALVTDIGPSSRVSDVNLLVRSSIRPSLRS